jgi:signal transduction histidine kinase
MPSSPLATRVTVADPTHAETLALLAAGTLHDVHTLLQLVVGHAERVLDDPALSDRSRRHVVEALAVGERAGWLARQMLAFARGDADGPAGMVDVVAALRAAEPLVRRVAGPTVTVTVDTSRAPLWVRATAVDLDRLIVTLAANGRNAMPVGGRLGLRAAAAPAEPEASAPGPRIRLTVSDTGTGRDRDGGAGQVAALATARPSVHWDAGLSVVREVASRLGGSVTAASGPHGGSTVVVDLPAVQVPPGP